jgi:peptide/nickel transport system substrate-binding protein
MNGEEGVPNERLRRARSLKGWSQADLAAKIGTSFEMVSRWERGVTVPSSYYRERLCAALGKTAEELGLRGEIDGPIAPPSVPLVLLVSSHVDAEKPIITHLKTLMQDQGITLWSSRQLVRQGRDNPRATLRAAMQSALALLIILSPEARASRHIREALAMASLYQLPIYGVWIEGERWQDYLPENSIEPIGVTDARASTAPVLVGEIATRLLQAGLTSSESSVGSADIPPSTPLPMSPDVPLLLGPPTRTRWGDLSRGKAWLLLGLATVIIVSAALGSVSVLAHLGASSPVNFPARAGTWVEDVQTDPISFIPDGFGPGDGGLIDQALYLPLFYGDAHGFVHPGAASEVPTVQNGGISIDARTWTFHLRPHLIWSDRQPYDARDVDFTWKLWANPDFGFPYVDEMHLISSATVTPDFLTITFHLKQAYAPFLQYWIDGQFAPLPAHYFSARSGLFGQPGDNLDPPVTSGPFRMAESVPGDHYTLVRSPTYYLAGKGLPYLDRVIFRVVNEPAVLNDLQAGAITSFSTSFFADLDTSKIATYQQLTGYQLIPSPTSASFEALFFNLHNLIFSSHPEVRRAMAMAVDQPTLIQEALQGFGSPLCTDHPSALHPGYQPDAEVSSECPQFDLTAANKLLNDYGWVKGADGVRSRDGQRLEFEYSATNRPWRSETEAILQRDFLAIGIKLDIQNYGASYFFGTFIAMGNPSPPTGAVADRFDIAEFGNTYGYDPDDAFLMGCDRRVPDGENASSYCNPGLDELYQQELTTADPTERQGIFNSIHLLYLTDLPFVVLYSPTDVSLARKGAHNYQPSPIDGSTIGIWEWWCDHGRC